MIPGFGHESWMISPTVCQPKETKSPAWVRGEVGCGSRENDGSWVRSGAVDLGRRVLYLMHALRR